MERLTDVFAFFCGCGRSIEGMNIRCRRCGTVHSLKEGAIPLECNGCSARILIDVESLPDGRDAQIEPSYGTSICSACAQLGSNPFPERIVSRPGVLGGEPTIRDTRIPARAVSALMRRDFPDATILSWWDVLTPEDLDAVRRFSFLTDGDQGERIALLDAQLRETETANAVLRYKNLTLDLFLRRVTTNLSDADEAERAEEMDDIWRTLSQEDQLGLERWIASLKPADLLRRKER